MSAPSSSSTPLATLHLPPRGRPAPDGQKLRVPPTRDTFDFRKSLLPFAMPLAKLARMKAHTRKTLSVGVVVVRV